MTAWALLGSYDWDSLVTREAGVYEPGVFDVRAPAPRPTALATIIRGLAAGDDPVHPVLSAAGWWRSGRSSAGARPLLVVGAGEPLARELAAACSSRGLAVAIAARHEVEGHGDAAAVIGAAGPWAVVDARQGADVDAAERDPEHCRHAHVQVPARLAAICGERRIPLLAFSSDQVFDGAQAGGYTEEDTPSPLNVLGASQVEAERRIRCACPPALIVRTGPLFGFAGDRVISAGLLALDAGGEWRAATDRSVSPAYVPHLIAAALDLLIDGERGIWHLANPGALTWWELAREAARLGGRPTERVVRAQAHEVWGPATRPSSSVLVSRRGGLMPPLAAALSACFAEDNRAMRAALCA